MPRALDSGDHKLLIGAGVVLVVLVALSAMLAPRQGLGRSPYPSTYSTEWDGAKAAFLLLQELGYQVSRWEHSPELIEGDAKAKVLILAEPVVEPTPEEKSAVTEFLEKGGRVLATGGAAGQLLPQASLLAEGFELDEDTTFRPLLPSPLARNAPEISLLAPSGWRPRGPGQLVVYGNEQTAAVVAYRVGAGQVIWWGASGPLTNKGLRESGNLALFLNSVGPAEGVQVLWDEYYHWQRGSLWTYFLRTPLVWGAAQLGILFLAVLFTFSRRQGPIRTPARLSRLSPLEFVETLGDLYSTAHAGAAAVRIAMQRMKFQLTRQLGQPANASNEDLAHGASVALAWNETAFAATLERADRAMNEIKVSDAETLTIVQELFDYTSRLELRRAQASSNERHTT